jgi:hypothetical protein
MSQTDAWKWHFSVATQRNIGISVWSWAILSVSECSYGKITTAQRLNTHIHWTGFSCCELRS